MQEKIDSRFTRSERILTAAEFSTVFSAKQRIRSGPFKISWKKTSQSKSRIGFAIAKKALPRAVDRNRVRRQTREYFRLHKFQAETVDIVVSYFGNPKETQQLNFHLDRLWNQLAKRLERS